MYDSQITPSQKWHAVCAVSSRWTVRDTTVGERHFASSRRSAMRRHDFGKHGATEVHPECTPVPRALKQP